jgi:hypothetical protein
MNRFGDNLVCTGSNKDVVEALAQNEVEFVLIGGLAVSWHCSERQADDMDLLVNPTPENSKRIYSALGTLHVSGFNEDSFTKPGIQAPLKKLHYAELLTPRKDGPSYSEVAAEAVNGRIFSTPARIASVGSLIRLKQCAIELLDADREKHIKDIKLLRKNGP